MNKIDYKKQLQDLYSAKADPKLVEVPNLKYITIEGQGDPNTSKEFKDAVSILYPIAYTLKFMIKKGETAFSPTDYTVMPLEGQWWSDDMDDFTSRNKQNWKWKMMILVPEITTKEIFMEAIDKVKKKKNLEKIEEVKFEEIKDGLSAQILHKGSFDSEAETINILHNFIKQQGYKLDGLHREIYFSDFRKVSSDKLKTIIRQPINK